MADLKARLQDDDDFVNHEQKNTSFESPVEALVEIDNKWYGRLSPRWMDLVGDFAGVELFVIDGKGAKFTSRK